MPLKTILSNSFSYSQKNSLFLLLLSSVEKKTLKFMENPKMYE